MEQVLNLLVNFANENIILLIVIFILTINIFLPASLVVIFMTSSFGLTKGILLSYLILLTAICIPYLLVRFFKINPNRFLSEDYRFIRDKVINKNPYKSILAIRITFIPFLAQNILCALIEVNFFTFFILNFLGLTPLLLLLAFFSDAIINLRTELLLISVILLVAFVFLAKKVSRNSLES